MSASLAIRSRARLERDDWKRLTFAFCIAVGFHILLVLALLFFVGAAVLFRNAKKSALEKLAQNRLIQERATRSSPPAMFVDVSKLLESTEKPKDTPFYSDKNSVAANKEVNKDSDTPKIDGSQTQVAKVEDAPRKKFDQLRPDPPAPKPQTTPKVDPGDLTLAKPDRPRTLRDAMLRNMANQQPGAAAKQDAGVTQRGNTAYNVKATGFGAYDRAFIDAVSSRWYALLDTRSDIGYRQGRVKIEFTLHYNGRISGVKIIENTVTDSLGLLCQQAIEDPAPFEPWPREMRLMVGEDQRRITFTFYYN